VTVDAVPVSGTWWRQIPAGAHVFDRPDQPPDLRWQHGEVVEGMYFADSPETAWAEWYRWLAEVGVPPLQAMPRDLWKWEIAIPRAADLSTAGRLAALDLRPPRPGRLDWPSFQAVGDRLYREGWPALVAPSAARAAGLVLCVFRDEHEPPGVRPVPPPERFDEPPAPPRGMTT
jgi:RES domain